MKEKNYKESENLNEEVVDPADVAEQQSPELCDNPDVEQATDDVTAEPAVEEDDLTRL